MTRGLRRALIAAAAVALPASVIVGLSLSADAAVGYPAHYAAPYLQITSATVGDMVADRNATGTKYFSLAFLIPKSGCTPMWEANNDPLGAFTSQVKSLQSAGGNVIISFGGADGGELAITCTSVSNLTAAYRNVVNTYGVHRLDFDIEGGTLSNTTANSRRNQALAALQAADPSVQIDFTVATDPGGVPSNVLTMLKDAKNKGVKINMVNIMTMDFGDGQNVLNDAESAANGLHGQLAGMYPNLTSAQLWNMEGLTTIAGQNDDKEFFSQSQANSLESFAAARGVQELAFWELHDYDRPTGYAYSKIFNKITGGTVPSPTPTGGGGGTAFTYVGAGSGKCIDDPAGSTTNNTQLEIWTCHSPASANQQLVATGGTLTIEGKCVDAKGGATANGTPIDIYTCNGGANQKFTYNTSNGTIVGSQSGKCVTVLSAATTNGAKLILYTCNGGSNQKWTRK
jgi:chitinase